MLSSKVKWASCVKKRGRIRILAIASGGGHWTQLLRLAPAWRSLDVAYASTKVGGAIGREIGFPNAARSYMLPDANRSRKLGLLWQFSHVVILVLRERPDVIITTGASVGFFALVVGKIFGARTVWIDSVANAEELSMSGKRAGRFADLWLTQWPGLACEQQCPKKRLGPSYRGSVL
jgi:UDP-N-acetylglucosamine:LPS N-acetylglucosamine transferase